MKLRVLLADDHPIMRDGLRFILERVPGVEVVGEAENGLRAVELANRLGPDVVVMDISMPDLNGVDATRQLKASKQKKDIKVIGLSMYSNRRFVLEMFEAGASGYVCKDSATMELVKALQAVAQDKNYIDSEISDLLVDCFVDRKSAADVSACSTLGGRERQVLQLLAEGKSSREIGSRMHIATATVKTHRRNIMRKLNVHNVAKLTKCAVRDGLTDLEK
jgi:DNA-binding NarL/FixJ family response regulator